MVDHVCDLSTNLHEQLIKKGKDLLNTALLLMGAATHLILPSCPSSFVE